jgi:pSer/pThr/pTyr-binding forkhead associated (FHA) protein
LGLVKVSTGETIELDRPLVIGRRPAVSRVQGIDMPKLITLDKAGREVSGSHVEVRLEGWHVIMRDLKSTNGTVLVRDGQNPRRLDQGEDTMLVSGDVVELGGAVSLAFEDLR